ncbi:MAG: hypothetical protein GF404_04810 [candidate division Zixibacteria bacterium]|nr:hypothetical protein [candidate division Zixibacteria bacterium]
MRTFSIAFGLFAIVFLLFCGCGGDGHEGAGPQYHDPDRAKSKTVAEVGESEIKLVMLEDLEDLPNANFETAEEEYEFKKAQLDTLINMYLMVEAAYAQGLDKDPEILKIVSDNRPDFLRDQLFKSRILPEIQVSDNEVENWYEQMKQEVHIFNIFVTDSAKADSLYTELKQGADFEAAARKHSEDNEFAVKGGDYGFRKYSLLTKEFRENVFNLKEGELALFQVPGGWNISKVVDRREAEVEPLEELYDVIRARIQDEKRQEAQNEYFDELFEKYDIKVNTETTQFIKDKIDALYPDRIGGKPFRKNTFNPDDLAQYEQNMILATYTGGEITLGEYLRRTARWEDARRPPFTETEQLEKAIFELEVKNFLLEEAREMKLDEHADFLDVMRFFKDRIMARKIQQVVGEERSFVTEDEIIQHYEANTGKYVVPRKVHLREILVNTEKQADEIHTKLVKGTDFSKLAEQHTVRPGMRSKQGDLGFIAEYNYPTLYEKSQELRINQHSEPFPVGDKWSIIKLLEIRQAERKELEEVASQIRSELQLQKGQQGLEQWVEELKEKYTVDVDYDLIWETIDKNRYESN